MNIHVTRDQNDLYNYIQRRIEEGAVPAEIEQSLEDLGYQLVYNGIYRIGVKIGNTVYYHPDL